MTYRLLHIADVHLDRSFAGVGCQGDLARRRRLGLRDALRRAGDLALQHGCQAVTVGGDLFEQQRCGADTERFLADTFRSWRPLRVFIAPGNHDALLPGSPYRRTAWPSNVHLFAEPEFVPVDLAGGIRLWGLAHREPAWRDDPLAGVELPRDGSVHLALFHGSELGSLPEGKPAHAPFRIEAVRRAGFAMALCGHYHRRRIDPDGGLVYPGTLEPLGFDESGPRGPVLVDVDADGTVACTPLDSNRWWALTVTCDLEGCASSSAVLDAAEAACHAAVAGLDPAHTMVRLDLHGAVDCSVPVDAYLLEAVLRERCALALVKVRDATSPAVDLALLAGERSTRGAFARLAGEALAGAGDADRAVLDDAVRYGLMALAGAEVGLR